MRMFNDPALRGRGEKNRLQDLMVTNLPQWETLRGNSWRVTDQGTGDLLCPHEHIYTHIQMSTKHTHTHACTHAHICTSKNIFQQFRFPNTLNCSVSSLRSNGNPSSVNNMHSKVVHIFVTSWGQKQGEAWLLFSHLLQPLDPGTHNADWILGHRGTCFR